MSDHERLMAFAAAVEMAYQDERATCEGNAFSVNSRKFIAVWLHARGWVAATPAPLDLNAVRGAIGALHSAVESGERCSPLLHRVYEEGCAACAALATPAPLDVPVAARAVVDAWEETVTATVISRTNWAIERLRYALAATPAPLPSGIEWEDVVDGLEVALSYPAEMEVNRERWRAARIAILDLWDRTAATPAPLPDVRGEVLPIKVRPAVDLAVTPAPLDVPVRGALARAWKRRAKMYRGLWSRQLREFHDWRTALRAAGISEMVDMNPDAIRLTVTVPREKRINEMVEERIALATPAPLDVLVAAILTLPTLDLSTGVYVDLEDVLFLVRDGDEAKL